MGLLLGEEDEKRKEYLFTGTRFPIVQHCCQQVWEDVESMDDDMNDNLMMSRGKYHCTGSNNYNSKIIKNDNLMRRREKYHCTGSKKCRQPHLWATH